MRTIREPAVAGRFYPGDPRALAAQVDALLDAATRRRGHSPAKAVVAPHAGYVYSGAIAAEAYLAFDHATLPVETVVLLGPAHRLWTRGLALHGAQVFATPLGEIEVDVDACARLADLPQVERRPEVHAGEHSLEVHLPFLQRYLGDFRVVPLVVGGATPEQVAEVLARLWNPDSTRVLVSSDLSHFLPYERAAAVDQATVESILRGDTVSSSQACGAHPVNGLTYFLRGRGLTPEVLALKNSGDTAGSRAEVVGYASIAWSTPRGGLV